MLHATVVKLSTRDQFCVRIIWCRNST